MIETQSPNAKPAAPAGTSGFWALIVTQFQGAFSDNVVKNLVVFVALFGTGMTLAEKNSYGESIAALFSLPFILFSMAGGFLADRFSKRSVMLGVKLFEFLIMSLVLIGLIYWNKHWLLAGVFLMGTHSAIFGPSKYGSLPELLPDRKLSWGNGILELGTFMAIILGLSSSNLRREQLTYTLGTMGIMAHELRTPLATMQLIGEALRNEAREEGEEMDPFLLHLFV